MWPLHVGQHFVLDLAVFALVQVLGLDQDDWFARRLLLLHLGHPRITVTVCELGCMVIDVTDLDY